jgi:tetratricopeptide (TPR) repeat protein
MLDSEVRVVNLKTIKLALAFAAVVTFGVAQDPPKPAQKVAKDQAEADLIGTIMKDTNAASRLAELEKWLKDYPDSQFADERDQGLLTAYQQLQKNREAFNKAVEILGKHPDDFTSLYTVIAYLPLLNNNNPPPADLDTAEKVINHVLNDGDAVFAASNKPATMTDAQWGGMKAILQPMAQKTLGYIYFQRKDNARATTELTKALQMDPTQGSSSYMLYQALFAQRTQDPTKQVPAFFELARAATYDGPNALPAPLRGQLLGTVKKYYAQYHGSDEGLDKMLASAKTNALPPADFTILSTAQIAQNQAAEDEKKRAAAGPMITLWTDLKTSLTGPDGEATFNDKVKDAAMPGGVGGVTKFRGKLISSKPTLRPKEIVVAVEKPGVGDATLKLEEGTTLPGSMEPGGDIEFEGTAKAFTKDPYMLTFEVTKDQIVGWTGKGAAAPKKAAPKKTAQQ